jgi:hypothetical protein
MSTDVLTVTGVVFGGLGVVVAAVSGALGAVFGYRAVVAGRQAVDQGRFSVAEARAARREEHLYRELDRLERLAGLLKRMWAVINRLATAPTLPAATDASPAQEMDALLYDLRAVLMMFGRDELPRCTELADGHDGRRALGAGSQIQEAENEVKDAITRCRAALRALE